MNIEKVTFHGLESGPLRAALILLDDGTRINAWYNPRNLHLERANSLPRDPNDKAYSQMGYRKRNLQSKAGKRLALLFKAYADQHERAAIKAIEDKKARGEEERAAAVAKQQEDRANAAAQVVSTACRFIACGGMSNARSVVDALIAAGFIDRDG